MKQLICNRCGKIAKTGKSVGDRCSHFNDTRNEGVFCTGLIKQVDNYDGAPVNIVARELKKCVINWDPKARLLGNVRAEDIERLCDDSIRRHTTSKHKVPAVNFIGTMMANVDNEKMSDSEFREFIRNTLPIVEKPLHETMVNKECAERSKKYYTEL